MTIDNTNLLQMCNDCGVAGFIPELSYTYDAGGAELTIVNGSTLPGGVTFTKAKVRVHDFFGAEVRGVQTVQATDLVIDVSTLNRSKPLTVTATIILNNNIVADGSVSGFLEAAGDIGFFDIQKNATA